MITENAPIKRDPSSSGEAGSMSWRCGFWVEVHLLEGGGHVECCITASDEAIALVEAYAVLQVGQCHYSYTLKQEQSKKTHNSWGRFRTLDLGFGRWDIVTSDDV